MQKVLLALVLLAVGVAANAVTVGLNFSWTQSTTYADGTAMPGSDITGNTLYDGTTVIGKLSGNVSLSGPVPVTFTTCGMHAFSVTVTAKNGIESAQSAPVNIFLCQPKAPALIFLP